MKTILSIALSVISFALCVSLGSNAFGGELKKETLEKQSYSDSRERKYQVYIPDTYTGNEPVPMVVVLHGCQQTEGNMINETRFDELAERDNFIVVYPFITSYDGFRALNCWGFWFNHHIHEGGGEAEDLYQIALEVESQYNIDPNRRYITGLSSGGAMSVVMAVAQSEYFAAAGAAAGLPYSEAAGSVARSCSFEGSFKSISSVVSAIQAEQQAPEEKRKVPIMTIHSNNDCVVNKKGAENIRDSWVELYGADVSAYETKDCTKEGVSCTHKKYGVPGRSVVETVFYNGKSGELAIKDSHYWAGDNSGEYANPQGPSASELFWDFFKRHPFNENQAPVVTISSCQQNGPDISCAGKATDNDAGDSVESLRIKFVDNCDEQNVLIAEADISSFEEDGSFSHNAGWPNNDTFYIPVIVATDSKGTSTTIKGTPVRVGNPPIIVATATVNEQCINVSGTVQQGSRELAGVQVKVDSGSFEGANGILNWTYEKCGLSSGKHTVVAKVSDIEGSSACRVVEVDIPSAFLEETGTTIDHISRFDVYPNENYPDAPSNGFGLCDRTFVELNNEFGTAETFTIYGRENESVWCADPANLSENGTAPVPGCEEFTSTIGTHVSNGRAYSIGWWIFKTYYTKGTDVQLTGSSITTITLHENAGEPGKFYLGGCD